MASGTKEDVFAALTDIENTEKIYLDNGVYKRNTTLRSSWDLRIVHEGDQRQLVAAFTAQQDAGDVFPFHPSCTL